MTGFLQALQPGSVLAFIGLVVGVWLVTGRLRLADWLRSGDSRKINHVVVLAGGACWFGWDEPNAARVGSLTAGLLLLLLVGLTCWLRRRPPFSWAFAGNTRPSDAPHEALFFWSSWLAAFVALFVIQVVVWDNRVTRLAALVLGIGDGLGEPIGSRWGRMRYPVPGGGSRSLEGSLAVAIGAFAVLVAAEGLSGGMFVLASAAVALAVALVEAVSPRGLDNFTVPLAAATGLMLARPFFGEPPV